MLFPSFLCHCWAEAKNIPYLQLGLMVIFEGVGFISLSMSLPLPFNFHFWNGAQGEKELIFSFAFCIYWPSQYIGILRLHWLITMSRLQDTLCDGLFRHCIVLVTYQILTDITFLIIIESVHIGYILTYIE